VALSPNRHEWHLGDYQHSPSTLVLRGQRGTWFFQGSVIPECADTAMHLEYALTKAGQTRSSGRALHIGDIKTRLTIRYTKAGWKASERDEISLNVHKATPSQSMGRFRLDRTSFHTIPLISARLRRSPQSFRQNHARVQHRWWAKFTCLNHLCSAEKTLTAASPPGISRHRASMVEASFLPPHRATWQAAPNQCMEPTSGCLSTQDRRVWQRIPGSGGGIKRFRDRQFSSSSHRQVVQHPCLVSKCQKYRCAGR